GALGSRQWAVGRCWLADRGPTIRPSAALCPRDCPLPIADRPGRASPPRSALLDRVPALLDVRCHVGGGLAADKVDHAGPEGAGADLAGHQVRAVEAEGRGVDK